MSPEAPRLDDTPGRKRVKITPAEKFMLGKADPHGPEATAFLELNGLKLGDTVELEIEGEDEPAVFGLSEHDFFVRDREATEALNGRDALHEKAEDDLADTSFDLVGPDEPDESVQAPVVQVELADAPAEVARDMMDRGHEGTQTSNRLAKMEEYYGTRTADTIITSRIEAEERIGTLEQHAGRVDQAIEAMKGIMPQAAELHKVAWGVDNDSMVPGRAQENLDIVTKKLREIHAVLQEAAEVDSADVDRDLGKLTGILANEIKELEREDETAKLALGDLLRVSPEAAQLTRPEMSSVETQAVFAAAIKEIGADGGFAKATEESLLQKTKQLREAIAAIEEIAKHARFGALIPENIYQLEETLKEIADPETAPAKLKEKADAQAAVVRKAIIDAGAQWGMNLAQ